MVSLLRDIETHKEFTFPIVLVGLFLIFIYTSGSIDDLFALLDFTVLQEQAQILTDDFVNMLGAVSIFVYGFIPSMFRIIGTTGFFIALLADGINPFTLIILGAVGETLGSSVLYLVGRGFFKYIRNKGIDKKMAGTDHLLSKYRIFIYFLIPYLGTAGDIIMLISGHERIGLKKYIPFLFLGNFFRYGLWLMVTISQIDL